MTGESNGSRNIVTCPAGAGDRQPAVARRNYLWPVDVHRSQPVSTPPSFSLSLALSLSRALSPPSPLPSLPLPLHRRRNFAKKSSLIAAYNRLLGFIFSLFPNFLGFFWGRGNLIFSPVLCRWSDQRSSTSLPRLWSSSSFRYANERLLA